MKRPTHITATEPMGETLTYLEYLQGKLREAGDIDELLIAGIILEVRKACEALVRIRDSKPPTDGDWQRTCRELQRIAQVALIVAR